MSSLSDSEELATTEQTDWWKDCSTAELKEIVSAGVAGGDRFIAAVREIERRSEEALIAPTPWKPKESAARLKRNGVFGSLSHLRWQLWLSWQLRYSRARTLLASLRASWRRQRQTISETLGFILTA